LLYDINKLLQSNTKHGIAIGWFLFDRNLENGLNKEETTELIDMINKYITNNERDMEEELEKAYQNGYEDGTNESRCCW
jgi:hypothetical protein